MAVLPRLPSDGMYLIFRNMQEARQHGTPRRMALPYTYFWFYRKVRNGGDWDYKQHDHSMENFGNFNYGAAGFAAGIPEDILLMGAGYAQRRAGTSKPSWGTWYGQPPYGDDPRDQFWIAQGIEHAKQLGY